MTLPSNSIARKRPEPFGSGLENYLVSREDRYLRTIRATLKTMA